MLSPVAAVTPNTDVDTALSEKAEIWIEDDSDAQRNPVVEGAEFAYTVNPTVLQYTFFLTVVVASERTSFM